MEKTTFLKVKAIEALANARHRADQVGNEGEAERCSVLIARLLTEAEAAILPRPPPPGDIPGGPAA